MRISRFAGSIPNERTTQPRNGQRQNALGFSSIVFLSRPIWRLLIGLVVLVLVLSYFDVVNISYDNGLKVRVGADPELKKQEALRAELDSKIAETKQRQAVYAERRRKGNWQAIYHIAKNDSLVDNYRCIHEIKITYSISITDSETTEGTVQVAVSLRGFGEYQFVFFGGERSRDEALSMCLLSANIDREFDIKATDDYGSRSIDHLFTGEFWVDQAGRLATGHLVEVNCRGACMEFDASIEAIALSSIAYRGRDFDDNLNDALVLSLSRMSINKSIVVD